MKSSFAWFENKSLILTAVFLCAILVQIIFLPVLLRAELRSRSSDYTNFYKPVANNMLLGKGITDRFGNMAISYPPGYPIIISAIIKFSGIIKIDELSLIIIFNIFVTAATALFLYCIAESIFNRKIALIASLMWITYPFNLWLIRQPNTEVPFICLMYMATWIFFFNVKKNKLSLSLIVGMVLGMAALIRPIAILCGLIYALLILFFKEVPRFRRMACSALILAGFVFIILPWEMHVFFSKKEIIPLSSGGPPGIVDGLTFAVKPGAGGHQVAAPKDVMLLMNQIRTDRSRLNTIKKISDYFFQEFAKNPKTILKLVWIKIKRSWYATDEMWHENFILLIQLFYLLTSITGLLLVFMMYKNKLTYVFFLIAIIFYFWFMTILALSILRYMVPIMGFIIIFSAISVDAILENKFFGKLSTKNTK